MERNPFNTLWTHLHWLTVLEEHGSFTRAAERLQVSKAAVSQKITELERAVGLQLVQRTTRSVRLTQAGIALAATARQPFAELSSAVRRVREEASEPSGLVRMTAPVAFSRQHLGPVIAEFAAKFSMIRVELDLSDSLRSLTMEGYDLAIRHAQEAPDTHVAWRLATTRALLVASPSYIRGHGDPALPDDLRQHSCLFYPRRHGPSTWSFTRKTVRGKREDEAIYTVPIGGPLAANNSEMLRDAAIAGMGIALVPDFSAQCAIREGKLVPVLGGFRSIGVFGEWLYAIRPYSPYVPASVKALVGMLRERFKAGFSGNELL